MSYLTKYLKYKEKYLELKNQYGSAGEGTGEGTGDYGIVRRSCPICKSNLCYDAQQKDLGDDDKDGTKTKYGDNLCILQFLNKLYIKSDSNIDTMLTKFKELAHEFNDIGKRKVLFSLKYMEGKCKLWTEWSRKARGSIYTLKNSQFYIIKELLDRGVEVLTKSQNKTYTETWRPSDEAEKLYTPTQMETFRLIRADETFEGILSMKVDGSLCSINLYPVNGYVHKLLEKFINEEIRKLQISQEDDRNLKKYLAAKLIMDISIACLESKYIMVISSHNTLFGDIIFIEGIISSILGGFLGLNWDLLLKEIDHQNTFKSLEDLIKKYLPTFCNHILIFTKQLKELAIINDLDNISLIFESVNPNRTDLFNNNQDHLLAVSYDIPMFRFLGMNYRYGEQSGIYLPHSERFIQDALVQTKLLIKDTPSAWIDPLFWYSETLNQIHIDNLLNDLEEVLLDRMTKKAYLIKYRPSNPRYATADSATIDLMINDEILDYEGFIFYRIIRESGSVVKYDYNKIKQRLYYIFHGLKHLTKHRDTILALPNSVESIYPVLKKFKIFDSSFTHIMTNIETEYDKIINEYILLYTEADYNQIFNTATEQTIKKIRNFPKIRTEKQIIIILDALLQEINPVTTDYVLNLFNAILNKYKLNIDHKSLPKESVSKNIFSKDSILKSIFNYMKAYYNKKTYDPKIHQQYIDDDDCKKDLYKLIWEHSSIQKDKIPIKVMSWNIMSNNLWSSEQKFSNLHGFDHLTDIIGDQSKAQRYANVEGQILDYGPDILLVQELNNKNIPYRNKFINLSFNLEFGNLKTDLKSFGNNCKYDEKSKITGKFFMVGTYYNKHIFELINTVGGCFLAEKYPTDSGSGYSCMLLRDKRTNKRVFILNMHISVSDWNDKDYSMERISDEINKYVDPFIRYNSINSKDIVIVGGDLNGGKIINHSNSAKINSYTRHYNDFIIKLLASDLIKRIGQIKEVQGDYITQILCKTNEGAHVDHIFSNINEDDNIIYNRKLNQLEFLRTSCLYDGHADIDQVNDNLKIKQTHNINRQINRRLRKENKDISDHRPVIADLYYNDYMIAESGSTSGSRFASTSGSTFASTSGSTLASTSSDASTSDYLRTESIGSESVGLESETDHTPKLGTIIVVYPISMPGVGKNYLFDHVKHYFGKEKIIIHERDTIEGAYYIPVINSIHKHTSGDMVLILNRNFDPSSLRSEEKIVIKEFTTSITTKLIKDQSINSILEEKSKTFKIINVALDFRNGKETFDNNDKFVSFINVLRRGNHPTINSEVGAFRTFFTFCENWKGNAIIPETFLNIKIQWHKDDFDLDTIDPLLNQFFNTSFLIDELKTRHKKIENVTFENIKDYIIYKMRITQPQLDKLLDILFYYKFRQFITSPNFSIRPKKDSFLLPAEISISPLIEFIKKHIRLSK